MDKISWEYYLISIVVLIAIWLILRPVFLWYYKVNRVIELQEENNELLKKLTEKPSQTEHKKVKPGVLEGEKSDLNDPDVLAAVIDKYSKK